MSLIFNCYVVILIVSLAVVNGNGAGINDVDKYAVCYEVCPTTSTSTSTTTTTIPTSTTTTTIPTSTTTTTIPTSTTTTSRQSPPTSTASTATSTTTKTSGPPQSTSTTATTIPISKTTNKSSSTSTTITIPTTITPITNKRPITSATTEHESKMAETTKTTTSKTKLITNLQSLPYTSETKGTNIIFGNSTAAEIPLTKPTTGKTTAKWNNVTTNTVSSGAGIENKTTRSTKTISNFPYSSVTNMAVHQESTKYTKITDSPSITNKENSQTTSHPSTHIPKTSFTIRHVTSTMGGNSVINTAASGKTIISVSETSKNVSLEAMASSTIDSVSKQTADTSSGIVQTTASKTLNIVSTSDATTMVPDNPNLTVSGMSTSTESTTGNMTSSNIIQVKSSSKLITQQHTTLGVKTTVDNFDTKSSTKDENNSTPVSFTPGGTIKTVTEDLGSTYSTQLIQSTSGQSAFSVSGSSKRLDPVQTSGSVNKPSSTEISSSKTATLVSLNNNKSSMKTTFPVKISTAATYTTQSTIKQAEKTKSTFASLGTNVSVASSTRSMTTPSTTSASTYSTIGKTSTISQSTSSSKHLTTKQNNNLTQPSNVKTHIPHSGQFTDQSQMTTSSFKTATQLTSTRTNTTSQYRQTIGTSTMAINISSTSLTLNKTPTKMPITETSIRSQANESSTKLTTRPNGSSKVSITPLISSKLTILANASSEKLTTPLTSEKPTTQPNASSKISITRLTLTTSTIRPNSIKSTNLPTLAKETTSTMRPTRKKPTTTTSAKTTTTSATTATTTTTSATTTTTSATTTIDCVSYCKKIGRMPLYTNTTITNTISTVSSKLSRYQDKPPQWDVAEFHLGFTISFDILWQNKYSDKYSQSYRHFTHKVRRELTILYLDVLGFKEIEVDNLRQGSIICQYSGVIDAYVNKVNKTTDTISSLQYICNTLQSQYRINNIGNLTKNYIYTNCYRQLNNAAATLRNSCNARHICPMGHVCRNNNGNTKCIHKCSIDNPCQNDGVCYINEEGTVGCRCRENDNYVYYGDNCQLQDEKLSWESRYIIALAVGLGCALLLIFLFVHVVCRFRHRGKMSFDIPPHSWADNSDIISKGRYSDCDNEFPANLLKSRDIKDMHAEYYAMGNMGYDGGIEIRYNDGRRFKVVNDPDTQSETYIYQPESPPSSTPTNLSNEQFFQVK